MGHSDIKTTMRYLHHKSRAGEAELLAGAFQAEQVQAEVQAEDVRESAGTFRQEAATTMKSPA